MSIEATGRCSRGCGAPVRWLLSLGDYRVCIDWPTPNPNGTVIIDSIDQRGRERAHLLTGADLPAQDTAYTIHECPRPAIGPACAACTMPMHPVLARQLNWITHPTCDPHHTRHLQHRRTP